MCSHCQQYYSESSYYNDKHQFVRTEQMLVPIFNLPEVRYAQISKRIFRGVIITINMFFTILRLFNLITSSGKQSSTESGTGPWDVLLALFLRVTRAHSLSSSTVRYPDRPLVFSSTASYQGLTFSRFMNISPPPPINFKFQRHLKLFNTLFTSNDGIKV